MTNLLELLNPELEGSLVQAGYSDLGYSFDFGAIQVLIKCLNQIEDERFDLNKFFGAVFTSNNDKNLNKIFSIENHEQTIGFCFPISFLMDECNFPNRFQQIYARAAVELIIFEGIDNQQCIYSMPSNALVEIDICEFFPSNSFILVIGKSLESAQKVTIEQLEINLIRHSIFKPLELVLEKTLNEELDIGNLRIKTVCDRLNEREKIINSLLQASFNQKNLFGKFLTLYQIIEILISDIFDRKLQEVVKETDLTSWKLKDKLSEISGELKRIEYLYSSLDTAKANMESFNFCCSKCINFLTDLLTPEDLTNLSWAKSIYRVRNFVVHAQSALISKKESELLEICSAFRLCLLEFIFHYN